MDEPTWVPRLVVAAAHFDQLQEHGGSRGLRDENLLESALARARQRHHYDPDADLAALAAAYAFGIATSHPFADGNKRTAFVTAAIFLDLNGHELDATDREVVDAVVALASGALGEEVLAEWFRARMRVVPPPGVGGDDAGT